NDLDSVILRWVVRCGDHDASALPRVPGSQRSHRTRCDPAPLQQRVFVAKPYTIIRLPRSQPQPHNPTPSANVTPKTLVAMEKPPTCRAVSQVLRRALNGPKQLRQCLHFFS